ERKLGQVPLFQWLFLFVGMPAIYFLTGLAGKGVNFLVRRLWERLGREPISKTFRLLSRPARILLVILVVHFMLAGLNLSLLARQFWSRLETIMAIVACVWLILLLNGGGQEQIRRRAQGAPGFVSILSLVRRTFDLLAIFGAVLLILAYFRLNVTAALAG